MNIITPFSKIWQFYLDGFKQMTWGRMLWAIILLKLFILFVILRIFFFKPALSGLNEMEKSECVGHAIGARP